MRKLVKIDYLLIGLLVALTGFEFLFRATIYHQVLFLLVIGIYFLFKRKLFNSSYLLLIILFSIPLIVQGFLFDDIRLGLANFVSFTVKFVIAFMILELVKDKFHITFVNFIYFLAIVSLVFFPTQFFPLIQENIKNSIGSIIAPIGSTNLPEGFQSKTLIFFTYMHSYGHGIENLELRNCGAFWEPGMFTVFLNLALLINLYINRTKFYDKKNIILIIAIITTQSTTGYLALFSICIFSFLLQKSKRSIIIYSPVIIILVLLAYKFIWNLDFIGEKISENIAISSIDKRSRFGAFLYHFNELKGSPWSGAAIEIGESDENLDFEDKQVSPNGLSLVFLFWGIPIGLLYYFLLYRGICNWLVMHLISNRKVHILFFSIFLILAFSQDVTVRFFYLMIIGFSIGYPRVKQKFMNTYS